MAYLAPAQAEVEAGFVVKADQYFINILDESDHSEHHNDRFLFNDENWSLLIENSILFMFNKSPTSTTFPLLVTY